MTGENLTINSRYLDFKLRNRDYTYIQVTVNILFFSYFAILNVMRQSSYYLKIFTIVVMLFFQAYYLSWLISSYVAKGNFFTFDTEFSVMVVLMMVLLAWTFSISVGSWEKNLQYLIIPVPTAAAIFFGLMSTNISYALIMAILSLGLLIYDLWKSTRLSKLLLKFEPTIILKFSTNGLLFLFSVLAGIMVLAAPVNVQEMNIGKQTAEMVGETLDTAIQTQIQNTLSGAPQGYLDQVDPSIANMLESFGLPTNLNDPMYTDPENLGIDTKVIVESQINSLLEPYKDFVKPIMALLLFGLFQFYAYIAYIIFSVTVNAVYWVAKKTSFLKTEVIQVEKEILKF